eukprot:SAG22_NODE_2459_length_2549_cov_1.513469_1_plen_491_part_01
MAASTDFDKSHWKPDKDVAACEGCQGSFGLIHGRRRHHCRQCGGVFCNACSSHQILLPNGVGQGAQRACDKCFKRYQDSLSVLALKVGNTHELISPAKGTPAQYGGACSHRCTTFVQAGDGGECDFGDSVKMVQFAFGNETVEVTEPPFEATALFAREVPIAVKIFLSDGTSRRLQHWLSFGHAVISKPVEIPVIAVARSAPRSMFSRPQFFRVLAPVTVTAEADPASLKIAQIQPGIVVEVFCSQVLPGGAVRLGLTRGWVSQRAADGRTKQLERVRSVTVGGSGGGGGSEKDGEEGEGDDDEDDEGDEDEDVDDDEYEDDEDGDEDEDDDEGALEDEDGGDPNPAGERLSEEMEALRAQVIDAVTAMVADSPYTKLQTFEAAVARQFGRETARAFKAEVAAVVAAQHRAAPAGPRRTLSYSSHRSPRPLSELLGGDVPGGFSLGGGGAAAAGAERGGGGGGGRGGAAWPSAAAAAAAAGHAAHCEDMFG